MDVNHATKLARQELAKQRAPGVVVAMLDDVPWLFNLCGADINFNPVCFSYVVVTTDNTILFVNREQVKLDGKF